MAYPVPGANVAGVVNLTSPDNSIFFNQPDGYVQANVDFTKITGEITGANIAAGTITDANIAAGTITGSNIAAGTITGANITAGTITGSNIAPDTITTTELGLQVVQNENMGKNSIDASNIVNGSIGNTELGPDSVAYYNLQEDLRSTNPYVYRNYYFDYAYSVFPYGSSAALQWCWEDSGPSGIQSINPGPPGSTGQGAFLDFPNAVCTKQPSFSLKDNETTWDAYFDPNTFTCTIGGFYCISVKIDAEKDQSMGGIAIMSNKQVAPIRQILSRSGEASFTDTFYVYLNRGNTLLFTGDYANPGYYSFPATLTIRRRHLQIICVSPWDWNDNPVNMNKPRY